MPSDTSVSRVHPCSVPASSRPWLVGCLILALTAACDDSGADGSAPVADSAVIDGAAVADAGRRDAGPPPLDGSLRRDQGPPSADATASRDAATVDAGPAVDATALDAAPTADAGLDAGRADAGADGGPALPDQGAPRPDGEPPAPDRGLALDLGPALDAGVPRLDVGPAPDDGVPALDLGPADSGVLGPDLGPAIDTGVVAPDQGLPALDQGPVPDQGAPDQGPDPDLGPPADRTVQLAPAQPTTTDPLVATLVPAPAPGEQVEWRWTLDDAAAEVDGARVAPEHTRRGQRWRATATLTDAEGRAAQFAAAVTIGNTPPRLQAARLAQARVARGEALTCAAEGFADADDDPEQVRFRWHLGDADGPLLAEGATFDTTGWLPDAALVCLAQPFDAFDEGDPIAAPPGGVTNTPPRIDGVELRPAAATADDTLHCFATASDPDGDAWRFAYRWYVDDARVEAAGAPTFGGAPGGAEVRCEVEVRDAFAVGGTQTSAPLRIEEATPRVTRVDVVGDADAPCAEHRCVAETNAPVELSYRWLVDGRPLPGETTPTLRRPDLRGDHRIRCEATPVGGAPSLSAARLLVDAPPVLIAATTRRVANLGEHVECAATGLADDCADPAAVRYAWQLGGAPVPGADGPTIDTAGLVGGLPLVCVATPDDGFQLGAPVASDPTDLVGAGFALVGDTAGGLAGQAVAVLDDLDADGLAEVLVGAPNTSFFRRAQAGQVYVVYGNESEQALPLAAVAAGEGGFVVAGEGGNYPLYHDLCRGTGLVDCPRETPIGDPDSRSAYTAGPRGDGLGFQVAHPGDVDGDGVGDLLVGAAYARVSDFVYTGKAYVVGGGGLGAAVDLVDAESAWSLSGECGRRRVVVEDPEDTIRATNGDLASWSLDGAGDVNGDGLADLLVGAPNAGDRDEGTAYVIYGTDAPAALRLSAVDARTCVRGDAPDLPEADGDALGFGVTDSRERPFDPHWGFYASGVGDWDGDGYDDVLVGAVQSGSPDAYIMLGAESQPDVDLNALSDAPNRVVRARAGFISAAGRRVWVCPDGTEVEPQTFCEDDGEFAVETIIRTQEGGLPVGQRGGGGGDVNGDGYSDVAFTMLRGTGDAPFRSVGVLFGGPELDVDYHQRAEALDRGLWIEGDAELDAIGGWVRTTGDLNGDGYDELVFGLPGDSTPGIVYVAYGGPDARRRSFADLRAGRGGFVLEGQQPGEMFGWSLDVGDVDGDGLDDLVVGAPRHDAAGPDGALTDAGRVEVVLGRDFANVITARGTPRDDVLVGGPTRDSLVGGRGDDHLVGGGGPDVLYGGAGDDRIEVADGTFHRVRGGRGVDTLVLAADASLIDWRQRVQGVERLELADGAQTLQITRRHLLRLSPHTNRLYVDGGAEDTVVAEDEAWVLEGEIESDGRTWRVLRSGRAELYLAPQMQTRFDPYVASDAFELAENSPVGTVVGHVEAVDPDGEVAGIELLDGPHADLFAVDAQGTLTVARAEPLDFESANAIMPLTFRVTDGEGLSADGVVEVRLLDVNEPPRFVGVEGLTFEWPEGGYDGTLLTDLLAVDADADDVLSYRLLDTEVPFTVDAATGTLSITGALDFEGQPEHTLALEVSDLAGLTDLATVTVTVIDADTFPQRFALSFVSRGQDIQTPADPCWIGPLRLGRDIHRAPGNPATIVDPFAGDGSTFAIDMYGNFEVDWQIQPSRGRLDSAAVAEVVLELPDEIEAGTTVDLRMLTEARSTAVSGETPGILVRFFTIFRDTRFAAWYCGAAAIVRPDIDYDRDCTLLGDYVIDPEDPMGEPLPYRSEREAPSLPFAAVNTDGPGRAHTGERADFFEYPYRIESLTAWIRRVTGTLVSPDGTLSLSHDVGDYQADVEMYPFFLEALVRLDLRTRIELIQLGVHARLTLEDGTVFELTVPTCLGAGFVVAQACQDAGDLSPTCLAGIDEAIEDCEAGVWPQTQLDIPAGADVNGDGRVDVDVRFDLFYDLTQDFDLVWQIGGAMSLGEALLRLTLEHDRENPERITNRHGPQVYAELVGEITENCPASSRPSFPTAVRQGALDLAAP